MANLSGRGRGGGHHRGRGRGQGGPGGTSSDEHQLGYGNGVGRSQANRGGRVGGRGQGVPGDGRGGYHGAAQGLEGISEDQKRQIREAVRPESIQVASEWTDDIIVASPANELVRHFAQMATRPSFCPSHNPELTRRFVNSCLLNLSNHHDVDSSTLISAMASPAGKERLKDVLDIPMGIDAAKSYGRVSFQFVILPFVGVLTRESICRSTMDKDISTIYAMVYARRKHFIKKGIILCMDHLLSRGSLADHSPAAVNIQVEDAYTCMVKSLSCALLAILRLIYQIIIRIRDARVELASVVVKLERQVQKCGTISNGTERDRFINRIMNEEIKRLQRIVSDGQEDIVFLSETSSTLDPPGRLSALGPRHDNDHTEISDISILPTQEEITCSRPPFLPPNGVQDTPHFLACGLKRQIDTHFRLYREDMMRPARQNMMLFLLALQHTPFGEEDRLLKNKELRKVIGHKTGLNVYGYVQIFGMSTEMNAAGHIDIGFSQPPESRERPNRGGRTEFWEHSQHRLMHGGLVCLVGRDRKALDSSRDATTPNTQLVLAVIAQRDIESLAKDEKVARISITLADPLQYLLLLNSVSSTSSKHWFLVESLGSHFGSYHPILKALQQTIPGSLPFGKYLAPTIEERAKIKNTENFVDIPRYAQAPGFQYDLSVLLNGQECRLDVKNNSSIEQAIHTLQNHSTLDDTQATGVVEALCREVALIQSPPGTGFASMGLALVQVLQANKARSECGPILYICSTDDALDRFLNQCLSKGILDIICVDLESKSKQLERYNMKALLDNHKGPYHVEQLLYEVTKDLKCSIKRMGDLERDLKDNRIEWKHVQSYLEQDYLDIYKQFRMVSSEDHESSDHKLKEEQEKCSFDRWRSGLDIQEKKAYNEEVKNKWVNNCKDPESIPPDYQKIPSTGRSVDLLLDGDIWNMSMPERQRLLDQWRPKVQRHLVAQLAALVKHVEGLNDTKSGAVDDIRCCMLRRCSVVGMTTAGATKSQGLIRKLAPKIIIYEEAGQVLESHILATLTPSTQHLILVGDHKQMRPWIANYCLSSEWTFGKRYNLDMSLFERLATSSTTLLPVSLLTTQRHMRPSIASLVRQPLYPDLIDGEDALSYPLVCGMGESLYFMSHSHPEDINETYVMQSYSNSAEVSMAKALTKYLMINGYSQSNDIAILTPYLSQLSLLRSALKSKFMLVINEKDQQQLDQDELEKGDEDQKLVHVQVGTKTGVQSKFTQKQLILSTVDNFQGEVKIVIISLVRNKSENYSSTSGNIEILKSPNRTNTLLTRAQHGMFIIGNADLMEHEMGGIWPSVIKELRAHNRVGSGFQLVCKNHLESVRTVSSAKQLRNETPNGGCTQRCDYSLPCGHKCPRLCHLDDIEHSFVKCYRKCNRLHPCLHLCEKLCGQSCGDCIRSAGSIVLTCGHTFESTCYQKKNPSTIICKTTITRKSPSCGHDYEVECWNEATEVVCSRPCGSKLPCGHSCTNSCLTCQKGIKHSQCKVKCGKNLFCDHMCDAPCHHGSDCPPCKQRDAVVCSHTKYGLPCDSAYAACSESCIWVCEHQGRCNMPCGVPCDRLPCDKRCTERLPCGHQCPSVCGEVCPSPKFCVECKDPDTMAIQVDMIELGSLSDIDVNENPIMVLSCGHALTMTNLDKMMEMQLYYLQQVDPKTGERSIDLSVPDNEVKPVSCPTCRTPITHLLRYGRRIKDAQLSIRLRRHQILQGKDMAHAKILFDVACSRLEKGRSQFMFALSNVFAQGVVSPPRPETQRLGKFALESDQFPDSVFWTIAETYSIPRAHREAWSKFIQPLVEVIQKLDDINKIADRPPTKQVFEAAVSRLYRLKVNRLSEGADLDASAVIKECIHSCRIPANGNVESSYVESLAEKTNALLLVLFEATAAMESIGPETGWYWFVQDLHTCCQAYNNITQEAALKGRFYRRVAYSDMTLLEILCNHVHWMSLRRLPTDEAEKQARLRQVDNLMEQFMTKMRELQVNCPESIVDECQDQVERIEKRMEMAVKIARGELPFNHGPTHSEKIQVYRAIQSTLRGTGHWYRCPNGHSYVIGECGRAMQMSNCPDCGEDIGGARHQLLSSNSQATDIKESILR